MKIGQLKLRVPGTAGLDIDARDVELTTDEFKDLTGLLSELNDVHAELEKLRSKDRP